MPYVDAPRPREPSAELGQSRAEQWLEYDALRLAGLRSIRRRLALVRAAKHAVGGRTLTDDELDAILPAVACRRTRLRHAAAELPAECVHGHPLTAGNIHTRPDGRILCRRCAARSHWEYMQRRRARTQDPGPNRPRINTD